MSRARKTVCCMVCLFLDGLCLASKGFELDTQGFLLLVLSNYLIYAVFAKLVRKPKRIPKGFNR